MDIVGFSRKNINRILILDRREEERVWRRKGVENVGIFFEVMLFIVLVL